MKMLDIKLDMCNIIASISMQKKRSIETVNIYRYLILILPSLRPLTHIVDSVRQEHFCGATEDERRTAGVRAKRMKKKPIRQKKSKTDDEKALSHYRKTVRHQKNSRLQFLAHRVYVFFSRKITYERRHMHGAIERDL